MLIDNFWIDEIDELEKIRLRNDIYQKEVQIKNLVDRNDKLIIENEKLKKELESLKTFLHSASNGALSWEAQTQCAKDSKLVDLIEELEEDLRWVKDSTKDAKETLSRIKRL